MIGWIRLSKFRETPASRPIELAAINDDASDSCAMPTNELSSRMYHNVGPMLQRLHQIGCWNGIIDNERQTMLMRNIGHSADVQRIQAWIAHCLGVDSLCMLIDGGAEILRLAPIHKMHLDAKFRQRIMEEVIGATIQAGRRDNLVTSTGNIENRQRLSRLAGRGRQRAHAPFQCRDTSLESIVGRVHNTSVNITKLLEAKQVRSMLRAVKHIGCGLIDRDGTRVSSAIGGLLTSM